MLSLACGKPRADVQYLGKGWDFELKRGFSFAGWATEVNHCWADEGSLEFDLTCPKNVAGTLKLYIIDGDNFGGGRKESISVAGKPIGEYESFQTGRWIEVPVSASDTASGRISVVARNLNPQANAVVSLVKFVKSL